ncbi:MAG: hypothetical protein ABII03_01210 [Nanoarchaeota archaeon]
MKAILTLLVLGLLAISIIPNVLAEIGVDIDVDIDTQDFEPLVWQCDHKVVLDDATSPGRITGDGDFLFERIGSYAFEGEQIVWHVLVMDANGLDNLEGVYGTISGTQGSGGDIEVICVENPGYSPVIEPDCGARIEGEDLTGEAIDPLMQRYYRCALTVETQDVMQGEYWMTVEAIDFEGNSGTMDENEEWFLNPFVAISVDGSIEFEDVRPGTTSYSETLTVGNDAEAGSGVMMDMFISGTDFYSSDGVVVCRHPTTGDLTNQLSLEAFSYYASQGSYTTAFDPRGDAESYVGIGYGIGFNNPNPFYDVYEIMQTGPMLPGGYYGSNTLSPGADISITFKLDLPAPCNGDFDEGQLFFWAEVI